MKACPPSRHGSENAPIDISILVVSYNTCEMTLAAISSALRETNENRIELIVVDNNSTDNSANAIAAAFPGVKLIRSKRNLGFAAANNLASSHASGRRLLLLNPDTVTMDAAIDRLARFADQQPQARIWGGRTFYADGRLNRASCWRRMTVWNQFCRTSGLAALFKTSNLFNGEAMAGWDRDSVREVDIVSGCFLLIDADLWQDLGGFAPVFFMYGEEADLCLRARRKGARPMITPEASIIHIGGASERVRADKMVRLLAAKTELIERHMSGLERITCRTLLHTWPRTRLLACRLIKIVKPKSLAARAVDTWTEILQRSSEWENGFTGAVKPQRITKPQSPTPLATANG